MYDIVIAGAGGCGRELCDLARASFSSQAYRVKGFLSDVPDVLDDFPEMAAQAPVLGTIVDHVPLPEERFIVAIGDPAGRRKVAETLRAKGAQFVNLIHPLALVSQYARLGEGVVVYPFGVADTYTTVGDFCMINYYAVCGHDAVMGDFSTLSPYAAVLGGAKLGEACFLAAHAVLGPKVHIGDRVMVSASSAALRDAPEDSLIMGVPGRNL